MGRWGRASLSVGALGVAMLLGIGLVGPASAADPFPRRLAGMDRVTLSEGPAAISAVRQLHRDSSMPMSNAYVVTYRGEGGRGAEVWESIAASESDARRLFEAMTRTVGQSGVFSQPVGIAVLGRAVSAVRGTREMGLHHYFYVSGRLVVWLRIDDPHPGSRARTLETLVAAVGS